MPKFTLSVILYLLINLIKIMDSILIEIVKNSMLFKSDSDRNVMMDSSMIMSPMQFMAMTPNDTTTVTPMQIISCNPT